MDGTPRRRVGAGRVLVGLAVLGLVLGYVVAFLSTYFLGCGLYGCRSGGKVAPGPVEGQLGLLVCGLLLIPLGLIVLGRGRRVSHRLVAAALTFVLGSGLPMLLIGIGPNGCPWGQTRAETKPGFGTKSTTCSDSPFAEPSG